MSNRKFAMIWIIAGLLFGTGCAQLLKIQDKSADQVIKGVNLYCESTDETFRANFRKAVNDGLTPPRRIQVDC